jgi:hypothetical protein
MVAPSLVFAATPEPGQSHSAVPLDAGSAALIVSASIDIARLLVNVGVVLVILSFAVMLLTVVATTPALMTEIKKLIEALRAKSPAERQLEASPAFPFSDLFRSMFAAIPELIRTPVGVGMGLVLLGVVLLLGQGAIAGGFTEAAVPTQPPPTSAPASLPATEQPASAPTVTPAPAASP